MMLFRGDDAPYSVQGRGGAEGGGADGFDPERLAGEARRLRAEAVAAMLRGIADGLTRGGRAVAAFVRCAAAGQAKRVPTAGAGGGRLNAC